MKQCAIIATASVLCTLAWLLQIQLMVFTHPTMEDFKQSEQEIRQQHGIPAGDVVFINWRPGPWYWDFTVRMWRPHGWRGHIGPQTVMIWETIALLSLTWILKDRIRQRKTAENDTQPAGPGDGNTRV